MQHEEGLARAGGAKRVVAHENDPSRRLDVDLRPSSGAGALDREVEHSWEILAGFVHAFGVSARDRLTARRDLAQRLELVFRLEALRRTVV